MEDASSPSPLKRKLVTILAADFVGFSKQMSTDEETTAQVLGEHRSIVDGIIQLHSGRIFNTAGDSVLAEFASPVEAVRAAVEIQDSLRTRNDSLPDASRLLLRIGINLGDVIIRGTDFLGDAVNVAARLENVAEPGGVLIAGSVYDQIAGKLNLNFQPRGTPPLKNITRPINTFSVSPQGSSPNLRPHRSLPRPRALILVFLFLAAVATVAALFKWNNADVRTAEKASNGNAGQGSTHWLNGTWVAIITKAPVTESTFCSEHDQRCRAMMIRGVSGDGTYTGLWGFTRANMGGADIKVAGDEMFVITPSNSTVKATRGSDGLMRGEMRVPDGSEFTITIRRVGD